MSPPLHVLVIEDNPNSRDLLCEMLALFGHKAHAAGSGEEGIALLETVHFDVLFADINLPGITGIDLAKTAAKIAPGIKIVFATGYGFLVTDKTDIDFFVLPKPYGLQQVKFALEQVAGSSIRDARLA